jgi:hypothetical protein
MLGHIGINVSNLQQAKAYYDQIMPLLGFELYRNDTDQFAFRRIGGKPGTYIFSIRRLKRVNFPATKPACNIWHLSSPRVKPCMPFIPESKPWTLRFYTRRKNSRNIIQVISPCFGSIRMG